MDDQIFIENGIAHFEVKFLGEPIILGCVEDEKGRAVQNTSEFEHYTGEVLRAVAGIDQRRAVLMAGVLAMERIQELEEDLRQNGVDRSDSRTIDPLNPTRLNLLSALAELTDLVHSSNRFATIDPEEHEQTLTELDASTRILSSNRISPSTLRALLIGVLTFLAMKFIDQPIGEAASYAWGTLKEFLSDFSSK